MRTLKLCTGGLVLAMVLAANGVCQDYAPAPSNCQCEHGGWLVRLHARLCNCESKTTAACPCCSSKGPQPLIQTAGIKRTTATGSSFSKGPEPLIQTTSMKQTTSMQPVPDEQSKTVTSLKPTPASAEPKLADGEVTTELSAPEKDPKPEGTVITGLKSEYLYHIGHAEDYSWVTGQLYYVHASGGLWIVRYATVDTEDKYGGSVVLAPAVNMKNFREGDLVSVSGGVADDGRASKNLGGPSYQATHVELIERADP